MVFVRRVHRSRLGFPVGGVEAAAPLPVRNKSSSPRPRSGGAACADGGRMEVLVARHGRRGGSVDPAMVFCLPASAPSRRRLLRRRREASGVRSGCGWRRWLARPSWRRRRPCCSPSRSDASFFANSGVPECRRRLGHLCWMGRAPRRWVFFFLQSPLLAAVYYCGVLQRGLVLYCPVQVLQRANFPPSSSFGFLGGWAMAVTASSADPVEKKGSRGLGVFSFFIRGFSAYLGTAVLPPDVSAVILI